MKILFYGFRHGHINALYRKVEASPLFEIAGCIEPNEAARAAAETNLGAQGIVTVMDQTAEHRYVAHLLYASPVLRGNDIKGKNIQIIEDIIPVYDTTLELKLDRDIKNVYLAPQMEKLDYTKENGKIKLTLKKLDCHQMIVLDY